MSAKQPSFEALENKVLRTKKDIEQEFKDLKFIHQHEVKGNNETIYEVTTLNGSFEKNYIITLNDDLYIGFEHETFIPTNLGEFWRFYNEHMNESNIFIDSRATDYIAYSVIKYSDNVLIYDVYTSSVVSVYAYCSKFFNIQTNEITINQIKQLFVGYLLLAVFCRSLGFEWNTPTMIKCIKSNDVKINAGADCNIFDMLIDYCKVKTSSLINTGSIYALIKQFEIYFGDEAYSVETDINPLNEWKLKNVSPYEFLITLTILKNNGFFVKCL